jgi:hypothetical protein
LLRCSLKKGAEVRSALAGALDLIVELIEDRGKRRDIDEPWDRPHDGD